MLSPLSLVETTETTGMGDVKTTWEPCGDHGDDMGDDVGTTGMMWRQQGPCGDNKITKNAITFETNQDN